MPRPSAERLRALRAEAAAQWAARLAAGDAPPAELRELHERVKMLDAALADAQAGGERRLVAIIWPLLLVAAVLSIAATVPVPSVPLTLELRASSVALDLPDPVVLQPQAIDGGELRVEGFSTLESADRRLTAAATAERADRIAVHAGEVRLRGMHLPAGARLTVQARGDATALQIESRRGPVIADIELHGDASLRLGDGGAPLLREFSRGEWLRLVAGDASRPEQAPPPMTVSWTRGGGPAMRFDGLRPGALRFAELREGTGAMSAVGSSIDGGTIVLPVTGRTVPLGAGDWLDVDGLVVERCELSAGAPLLLKLTGSARTLRLRIGEFERSLKPSLLEYVSRHHLVGLLWGSAAVLWGALVWVRRHFARAAG